MRLNIYKINNNGTDKLIELIEFIESKIQFNLDGSPVVEENGESRKEYISVGYFPTKNNDIFMHIYLKNKEKKELPEWLTIINNIVAADGNGEFLNIDKFEFLSKLASFSNDNYSGLIILEDKQMTLKASKVVRNHYVLAFGHASFDLSKYIDYDFGIDLASKIGTEPVLVMNMTPGATNIKKSTTTFNSASLIEALDLGSSILNFEVATVDEKEWGKRIFCGKSCIFEVEQPIDAIDFLVDLTQKVNVALEKKQETLKNLPRYVEVSEADSSKLNEILKSKIDEDDFGLEFEKDIIRDGRFYFSHEFTFQYDCGCGENRTMATPELSKASLKSFIELNKENSDFDLLKTKVKFIPSSGNKFSRRLFELFTNVGDIELFTGDKNRYCIRDGVWYKYNDSFVNQLKKALGALDNIFFEEKIPLGELDKYIISDKKGMKKISLNEEIYLETKAYQHEETKIHGTEDDKIMKLDNYKIEPADYINRDTLFFVKSGDSSSKLCYLVRQAKTSIKLFFDSIKNADVEEFKKKHNFNQVKNINLIILTDKKLPVGSLDAINLLSFQMEIYELYKICQKYELGLKINWLYSPSEDRKLVLELEDNTSDLMEA